MSFQKRVAQIFQKISWWVTSNVWPWSEIWRLREDLRFVQSNLQVFLDQEAQHQAKWMAEANRFWGPNKFTDGEEATMVRFYQQGYGWHSALSKLRVYCGYDSRYSGVKRG